MARVAFRRTEVRGLWAVEQDGVAIATLSKRTGGWWQAWMEGEKWLDAPYLCDLKAIVREALGAS